jgi:hypothetical protein
MEAVHNTYAIETLLTEHDVAHITQRSVASVRRDRLLKKGCPYIKISSSVRYRPSDVEAWLASLAKRGGHQAEAQ